MKTTLAILIAALATVSGAFGDQPVFNSKGTLLNMKRYMPATAKKMAHAKINSVLHSKPSCKSCCAR